MQEIKNFSEKIKNGTYFGYLLLKSIVIQFDG